MADKAPEVDWYRMADEVFATEGSLGNVYNWACSYSIANQVYLHLQGVHEPAATWGRWKDFGRHVKRGAKAKFIIRPIFRTETDVDGNTVQQLIGFKPVPCIFALSDTEGPDLPPVTVPGWDIDTALSKLGVRLVPFEMLNGNVQGYSAGLDIAINPLAANREKTLMHELAHVALGHTLPHQLSEYRAHRGLQEYQAELGAYIVMKTLGQLDAATASRSRAYIQDWMGHERPPEHAIRQVFTVADRIIRAGQIAVDAATNAE